MVSKRSKKKSTILLSYRKKIPYFLFLLFCLFITTKNSIAQPGTLDISFDIGAGLIPGQIIYTIVAQDEGKIIIGGEFTFSNYSLPKNIARINIDGSVDTSFNIGNGANDPVRVISTQSDGKIIVGGDFTLFNGLPVNRIARLNPDGTLDTLFNSGGQGANGTVLAISNQNSGKMVIGGYFTSFNGISRKRIARLNIDGSLDTLFNPPGTNDAVYSILTLDDGKLIVGGAFTVCNNKLMNRIARLYSYGTLDLGFDPGYGAEGILCTVLATAKQPYGKFLIGGYIEYYDSIPVGRIARINSDGTLDTTFQVGTGANAPLWTFSIQNDGKIVIAGLFTAFDGKQRKRIARLNPDGSHDTIFNPGLGTDNTIFTSSIQEDGKIMAGGSFSFYDGIARKGVARINLESNLSFSENEAQSLGYTVYPNPNIGLFSLEFNNTINANSSLIIYNSIGIEVYKCAIGNKRMDFDLLWLSKGVYFLRISSSKEFPITKIVLL